MAVPTNLVNEIQIAKWSEFESALQQVKGKPRTNGRRINDPLFRGLGDARWGLETTLERAHPEEKCDDTLSLIKYYRKAAAAKPAIETFTGKRWNEVPDLPEFRKLLNKKPQRWLDQILWERPAIYEYLVYLRHHGFPSPLLDWTASPYVAALFAFDSTARGAERVCIYALKRDTLRAFGSDSQPIIVGPYLRTHPRHLLQQCQYTMYVKLELRGSRDYTFLPHDPTMRSAKGPAGELLKITIPVSERREALRRLDLMNINPFSLFGSDDSLVRTIGRRECLFQSWGS